MKRIKPPKLLDVLIRVWYFIVFDILICTLGWIFEIDITKFNVENIKCWICDIIFQIKCHT